MANNLHLRGTQELKLCETVKAVDASLLISILENNYILRYQ